jgi:hypothetical protein
MTEIPTDDVPGSATGDPKVTCNNCQSSGTAGCASSPAAMPRDCQSWVTEGCRRADDGDGFGRGAGCFDGGLAASAAVRTAPAGLRANVGGFQCTL